MWETKRIIKEDVNMKLDKKINKLFDKKRELWNIFKIILDKYGIYDQLIMDEMIKVEKELNKVINWR